MLGDTASVKFDWRLRRTKVTVMLSSASLTTAKYSRGYTFTAYYKLARINRLRSLSLSLFKLIKRFSV